MTLELKIAFLSKLCKTMNGELFTTHVITVFSYYIKFVEMRKDFNAVEEPLPSLDDILTLREKREDTYKAFCVTMSSQLHVVAKSNQSSQVQQD
jgi:hypothetical protein